MTDADSIDDLVLLGQAKSLRRSLEHAARSIGLYVNANKTEFMYFKQEDISTLSGRPLKLVDKLYLGSNISSITEQRHRMLFTGYQSCGNLICLIKCVSATVRIHQILMKHMKKRLDGELQKNAMCHFEQILNATVQPLTLLAWTNS